MTPDRGRRVVESHTIARLAFRLGGGFAIVAGVWAVVVLIQGGSWWGPLHAFMVGTVLLAISGASQMFTITWAAASPPSSAVSGSQRWLLAGGVGAVLVGVTLEVDVLVWAGATALVASLALLAWSIRGAVKSSLLRRFDLSSRFYLTALACGAVGMSLGAIMGSGTAGDSFARMRLTHAHLNLVGLVGFTIVGTIPTFMPTVTHHRAVSGIEARVSLWLAVAASVVIAAGLWLGAIAVGAGTLLAGIAALVMVGGILGRLWEKGRHKTQFLQVTAGMAWLIIWAFVDGTALMAGGGAGPFGGWTGAVVLAGVGQILAGSLAYLLPVLAGPPVGDNLDVMAANRWIPLVAANVAGAALAGGWGVVAVVASAVWVADFGRRVVALRSHRD